MVTERVDAATCFMPFHFSGHGGRARTCSSTTRRARIPLCAAKSANTGTTYGYDTVTMMQETKTTVCQVVKA